MNVYKATVCVLLVAQASLVICQRGFGLEQHDFGMSRNHLQEMRIRELCDRLGLRYGDMLNRYRTRKRNLRQTKLFLRNGGNLDITSTKLDIPQLSVISEAISKNNKKHVSMTRPRILKVTKAKRKIKLDFGKLANRLKVKSRKKIQKDSERRKNRIFITKHKSIRPRIIRKQQSNRGRSTTLKKKKNKFQRKIKMPKTQQQKMKKFKVTKTINVKIFKNNDKSPKRSKIKINFDLLSNFLEKSRTKKKKTHDLSQNSIRAMRQKSKENNSLIRKMNNRSRFLNKNSLGDATNTQSNKQRIIEQNLVQTTIPTTITTSTTTTTMPTTITVEESVPFDSTFIQGTSEIPAEIPVDVNAGNQEESVTLGAPTNDNNGPSNRRIDSVSRSNSQSDGTSNDNRAQTIMNMIENDFMQTMSTQENRNNRFNSLQTVNANGNTQNLQREQNRIRLNLSNFPNANRGSDRELQRIENDILTKLRETPEFLRATRENTPEADAKVKEILDGLISNFGSQLPDSSPTNNPRSQIPDLKPTNNPASQLPDPTPTTNPESTLPDVIPTNDPERITEQSNTDGQSTSSSQNESSGRSTSTQTSRNTVTNSPEQTVSQADTTLEPRGNQRVGNGSAGQSDWMFIENELGTIFA